MVSYTVACRFLNNDGELANRWLDWLRNGHIQELLTHGAIRAAVFELEDSVPHFEIRYEFANRADLQHYLSADAPRLRAEGLSIFPLELGLEFTRRVGSVCFELAASE